MGELINLHFQGPFTFFGNESLFLKAVDAARPGVYLWTVNVDDVHKVVYVGMSGKSVRDRLIQHIGGYLSLQANVYESDSLKKGKRVYRYQAGKDDEYGNEYFINPIEKVASHLNQLLDFTLFYAIPFGSNQNEVTRPRIKLVESLLIRTLRQADPNFNDNGLKSVDRDTTPISIIYSIPAGISIEGFESNTGKFEGRKF